MTLKYTLIIEGTEKEIEKAKQVGFQITSWGPSGMSAPLLKEEDIKYKVVEPLVFEFITTVDELGNVDLSKGTKMVYMLGEYHAGKKVSVVITELD